MEQALEKKLNEKWNESGDEDETIADKSKTDHLNNHHNHKRNRY